ncbi:MAG: hypothetical protein V7707_09875 [Motiliproteus sp.]
MKDKIHKPGIHVNYLVSRHMCIEGLGESLIEPLVAQLSALVQVDDVSITRNGSKSMLNIAYDASVRPQPLDDIKQALATMGACIADDWWARFKQRYYEFTDQNVYDNARLQPHCCNKAPPGK